MRLFLVEHLENHRGQGREDDRFDTRSDPLSSPRLLILLHGLAGEHEGTEVQRRWWPQRGFARDYTLTAERILQAA
jgi:hypothetical protein